MSAEVAQPLEDIAVSGHSPAALIARVMSFVDRFPLASKGLLSIIDQGIVSATSFFTAVIIGRLTSASELGWYYLILSFVLMVSGTQDQLVTAPYVVFSKRRSGKDLAEYAGSVWVHQLILTLIAMVGLLITIAVFAMRGTAGILPGLWALMIAAPLMMLRDRIRRFAFANLRVWYVLMLDIIVAALQLGGLGLLAYFNLLSLVSIYVLIGAACAIASLGWYLADRPHVEFVRERIMPDWRHNWPFAKWALRTFLVGNSTPFITLWILGALLGSAATGLLGGCNTMIGLANMLLMGVDNVLTPQAAHAYVTGGAQSLRVVLLQAGVFLSAAIGGLLLLLIITGDWLAVLVFGSEFQGTAAILIALCLNMLMNSVGTVAGNGLWAINRPQLNFVADVCCMAVTLVGAALFIYPLGALGAALATLSGATAAAIVRLVTLVRQLQLHPALTNGVETSASTEGVS